MARRAASFASAAVLLLGLSAARAVAAPAYAACLHTDDAAGCLAGRAATEATARPWSQPLADLVRAGAPEAVEAFMERVRPFADIIREVRINPTAAELGEIAGVDPDSAAEIAKHADQAHWRDWAEAHVADYAARPFSPAARAGLLLAAAAYHRPDPLADPSAGKAFAAAGASPFALERAMRSIAGLDEVGGPYGVVPPGARAILDTSEALPNAPGGFWLVAARYAHWLGDDAAAARALRRAPPAPRDLQATAALWAVIGQPAEAEMLLGTATGSDVAEAQLRIGAAWLKLGDRAHAIAAAHRALAQGDRVPATEIQAIRLLAAAGASQDAAEAARTAAARAETAEAAVKSLALASASEALSAAGSAKEACALARRSLASASDSAAAQSARWSGRYYADVPLNVWLGPDFGSNGVSLDDLKQAYRDRAEKALRDCGAAGRRQLSGWEALAPGIDPDASAATRLAEAADAAGADPALAARLSAAVRAAREPEDPLALVVWRSGVADVEAAAGEAEAARASYGAAVRGLDQLGNPEDRRSVISALARDGRLVELRLRRAPLGRRQVQQ